MGSCQLMEQLSVVTGREKTAWGSVLCHVYIKVFKVVEDELQFQMLQKMENHMGLPESGEFQKLNSDTETYQEVFALQGWKWELVVECCPFLGPLIHTQILWILESLQVKESKLTKTSETAVFEFKLSQGGDAFLRTQGYEC